MMEQIIQQQQPLCAALIKIQKTELMSNDKEIKTMETLLKPIVEITEAIGGERLVIWHSGLGKFTDKTSASYQ